MFTIQFRTPYGDAIRTQSFGTLDEAKRMIAFYASCGTIAKLV